MLLLWSSLFIAFAFGDEAEVKPCNDGTIIPNVLVHKPTITHAPTPCPTMPEKDLLQKLDPKYRWVVNGNGQPEQKGMIPKKDTNDPKNRLKPCHEKRTVIRPNIPADWTPPPCLEKTKVYRPTPAGANNAIPSPDGTAAAQETDATGTDTSSDSSATENATPAAGKDSPSSPTSDMEKTPAMPCGQKVEVMRAIIPIRIHDNVRSAVVAVNDMFRIVRPPVECEEFISAQPIQIDASSFTNTASSPSRFLEHKFSFDLMDALEFFVRRV